MIIKLINYHPMTRAMWKYSLFVCALELRLILC